jgi:DNA-binding transcriptional MerR regulator
VSYGIGAGPLAHQPAVRGGAPPPRVPAGYSIGQLAGLTGLPVKTIRFYSDAGVLPPAGRTEAGHRRYGEADLARLRLARSLRELDVDLPTIRRVLDGRSDLGEILAAHVAAVEARIRALQRQRAVLRAAGRSPSDATVRRVQALARLDAAERRQLLEHFWDRVLEDTRLDDATAARFRASGTPELPDDPTPEQLDAWLELAELVADEDFQQTTRANARWVWDASGGRLTTEAMQEATADPLQLATEAVRTGIAPDDARAAEAVESYAAAWARLLGRTDGPGFRAWLVAQIDAHTDPRAARYWELVAAIQGDQVCSAPARERAAAGMWLIAALRRDVLGAGASAGPQPPR